MPLMPIATRDSDGLPVLDQRLAALFAPGAVVALLAGAGHPDALSTLERDCTATFGTKRLGEFAAGRSCARVALEQFGIVDHDLTIQEDRRPRWPAGIVGSITHTSGFCAAVAARCDAIPALGIDVERRGRMGKELWPSLFVASERRRLDILDPAAADRIATLLFSAKEAFYKCRFALRADWLDFTDVEIAFEATSDARTGAFEGRVIADRFFSPRELAGRFAFYDDVVWTGVSAPT